VLVRQILIASMAMVAVAAAVPAAALPLFDFDTVQLTNGTGNNAAVQTYLNNTAGPGIVTVYGALAQRTYNRRRARQYCSFGSQQRPIGHAWHYE
jgi:hypothetical protein